MTMLLEECYEIRTVNQLFIASNLFFAAKLNRHENVDIISGFCFSHTAKSGILYFYLLSLVLRGKRSAGLLQGIQHITKTCPCNNVQRFFPEEKMKISLEKF